jgi:hypothetical protein
MLRQTRTAAEMNAITQTIEAIHQLTVRMQSLFAELHDRREKLADQGIVIDVALAPGIDAAYSLWKQARARQQGREIAAADAEDAGWSTEAETRIQ